MLYFFQYCDPRGERGGFPAGSGLCQNHKVWAVSKIRWYEFENFETFYMYFILQYLFAFHACENFATFVEEIREFQLYLQILCCIFINSTVSAINPVLNELMQFRYIGKVGTYLFTYLIQSKIFLFSCTYDVTIITHWKIEKLLFWIKVMIRWEWLAIAIDWEIVFL